jgi:hypothetical protein
MMLSAVGLVIEAWQVAADADIHSEQQNRGIERQRRDADSRDAVYRTIEFAALSSTAYRSFPSIEDIPINPKLRINLFRLFVTDILKSETVPLLL